MNNYRLIILGDEWDVYLTAYKDLIDDPKILYIPTFRPKGLLGQLQRMHLNPRLNHLVSFPGKNWWNPLILSHIKKEQRLCFLILDNWLRMECGIKLLPYLRQHYPQARIVCFAQDLVATIKDHYSQKSIDVDYLKQYADLLISYDKNDASQYGLLYHPTVFSPIVQNTPVISDQYDLYFLGRDKGRLPLIIDVCIEAERRGLRCKMIVIGVPKEKRIPITGIEYIDGSLTYLENLKNCTESRCIIEMLQQKASSPTFRTWEAIMLNKKLITNSASIKESEVYDERYISVFHDLADFDWSFAKNDNPFSKSNPYQELIKPESLVRFIEDKLQIQIEHS